MMSYNEDGFVEELTDGEYQNLYYDGDQKKISIHHTSQDYQFKSTNFLRHDKNSTLWSLGDSSIQDI